MISVPTVGETEDKGTLQHDVYKNYYEKIFVLVVYDTKGIDGKWKPTEFDIAKENMIKLAHNKTSRVFNFDEGKLVEFIKNEPGLGKIKVAECDQTSIPDACRKVQDKCQMKLTWQFRAQFEQTCVERGIELKKLEVIDCNEDECNCLIIYIDIYTSLTKHVPVEKTSHIQRKHMSTHHVALKHIPKNVHVQNITKRKKKKNYQCC